MRKIWVLNSVSCRVYKLTDVRADGLHQRLLCMPTGSTLNAPTGCLFNAQRAEPNWAKAKEREKEWGPREIESSLSPTQAHYHSIYHLSGAMVDEPTWELISNQCGTQA